MWPEVPLCYEIKGQTGVGSILLFPPRLRPLKSPEYQAFPEGKS